MASKTIVLTPEVRAVLEDSTISGFSVKLRPGLDRKLYTAVNKALESAGGEWNTRAKAHLFTRDPREALDLIKAQGVFAAPVDPVKLRQQELQAYYTPAKLAQSLVALADVRDRSVLEPSCGPGAIVRTCVAAGASSTSVVEIDPEAFRVTKRYLEGLAYGEHVVTDRWRGELVNRDLLTDRWRGDCINRDFLTCASEQLPLFDRVVMNPPFADGQDFLHIRHALQFLFKPEGTLTSIIMGDSNVGALAARVRKEVAKSLLSFDYKVWPLPENSFKESGTGANTAVIQISNLHLRAKPEHGAMFLPMLDW